MYHRILPADAMQAKFEEPGMMVTPETFENNLILLSELFEFTTLSKWIERKNSGQTLPQKACVITFDDGWADNYEYAFPVLKKMNIPATIFAVAEMLNTHAQFWPERLARVVYWLAKHQPDALSDPSLAWIRTDQQGIRFSDSLPNNEELSVLIGQAKRFNDSEIHAYLDNIEQQFAIDACDLKPSLLSWTQLKEMHDSGLIDVGSHTCHHIRLNEKVSEDTIQYEITASKQILEKQLGGPINTFCFPNGDYSNYSLSVVKQNYAAAVTTQQGWNTDQQDNHLLQRIGVHEDAAKDPIAFQALISGWH
ncbi:MAG: polysaccharide deacetylase family protein [Gammaproteobacteria bacterium]|nr:polysaccharide deacetylase family protein [Gammaproteobacteria bacterium]